MLLYKYMEDLGSIEINWSDYEMKVAPFKINVNWSNLAKEAPLKEEKHIEPKKSWREPVKVKYFAWDANGTKYNLEDTFLVETFSSSHFWDTDILMAMDAALRNSNFVGVDFERESMFNRIYWEHVCNKPVWSTKE